MLILASGSPRRHHLLQMLGVHFQVVPSDVHERDPDPGEDPAAYALALARQKAAAVFARHATDVVLSADTVVAVDDSILGKPADGDDALRMLRLLRGREHRVTTAVVVRRAGLQDLGTVTATVRMRPFSDEEALAYIATGEPMDKAGAYAVQEFGGTFVEAVEGCYNTVVGFPLCLVATLLQHAGIAAELPRDSSCRSHAVSVSSIA